MIPKKIHYCWFGRGEKPKLAQKCIASWKTFCPDYKIIEWNEDNFDVNYNAYTKYCYDNKKWAFLSDYVRLVVIYKHGGIYFDTDVELIKNPDRLLYSNAFYGFENDEYVATGLGFGAMAGHPSVAEMIRLYDEGIPNEDGTFKLISCPHINTEALKKFGLKKNGEKQFLDDMIIYPREVFNPLDDATGVMHKTSDTYSINHYGKSWLSKGAIIRSKLMRPIHRLFGNNCFEFLKNK